MIPSKCNLGTLMDIGVLFECITLRGYNQNCKYSLWVFATFKTLSTRTPSTVSFVGFVISGRLLNFFFCDQAKCADMDIVEYWY